MKNKRWNVIYQLSRRAATRREGEELREEGESLVAVSNGFARYVLAELYETWQEALTAATDKLQASNVATDKATINLNTRRFDGSISITVAGVLTKVHTASVGYTVRVKVFDDVDYNVK